MSGGVRTYLPLPGAHVGNNAKPIGNASVQDLGQWAQKNAGCFKCSIVIMTAAMVGVLIAILVLLAAGAAGSDMMLKTSESTIAMRNQTEQLQIDVKSHIKDIMSHFPDDKEEVLVGQAFNIVENVHKISSRVEYLLNHMEPDTVPNVINSVNSVLEKVQAILGNVDANQSSKIMAAVDHVQELIANISPDQVQKIVDGVGETSEHVGHMTNQADENNLMSRVLKLVDDAESVVSNLKRVHSVTIDLPQLHKEKNEIPENSKLRKWAQTTN